MKLLLTPYAWEKMRHYVDGCTGEVSGMGKVEIVDGELTVTDCTIFEQTVSGVHSDIETHALAKFQVELVQKGEDLSHWKLWWHSHADMGVFWSGRDTDTIDSSTEFEYMVSLVTNHAHDLKARVDTFKPLRLFSDLSVEIQEEYNVDLKALCDAEILEKVKKPAIQEYKKTKWDRAYLDTMGAGFRTGGRYFDDEWFDVNPDGKKKNKKYVPEEIVVSEKSKEIEDYYDRLEELENEVADAIDETTLSIATKTLWEHKQTGIERGW